jgi:hypothetical protein
MRRLTILSRRAGLPLRAMLAALSLALSGCAGMYFKDAGPPPVIGYSLESLPYFGYWTGIVFNGEKVGFSHFDIRKVPGSERREIKAEASMVLQFLGLEKKILMRSRDVINPDLTLVEFDYWYRVDESEMQVTGRREGGELLASIVTAGVRTEQRLPVAGKLYPSGVISLYPVVQGLEVGREYKYLVYHGQTQAIAEVTQRISGYEKSDLFLGNAFKVEAAMRGQRVTSWIGHDGRLLFELAMSGVLISFLEDADSAHRYLALASLNKKESLVEFSLVRPDRAIGNARALAGLRVALSGSDRLPPSDGWQRCTKELAQTICAMGRAAGAPAGAGAEPASAALRERYLRPSIAAQSADPAIRRLADTVTAGAATDEERIARILRWLDGNIEKAPIDAFSALDVLKQRKAECQGHAYLYAALARAAGVPTRVASGLVYAEQFQGFLYHSWTESLVGTRWQAVDPIFGQAAADATHIKLVEGEDLADLMPLTESVGKLQLRVLAVEY